MIPASVFIPFFVLVGLYPVCILLHEFGHAIPILLTGRNAHVIMGDDSGKTFQFGKLKLTFGISGAGIMYRGYCRWDGNVPTRTELIVTLGGPIVTLAIVAILTIFVDLNPEGTLETSIYYLWVSQTLLLVLTSLPMTLPSWLYPSESDNDGKQILDILLS